MPDSAVILVSVQWLPCYDCLLGHGKTYRSPSLPLIARLVSIVIIWLDDLQDAWSCLVFEPLLISPSLWPIRSRLSALVIATSRFIPIREDQPVNFVIRPNTLRYTVFLVWATDLIIDWSALPFSQNFCCVTSNESSATLNLYFFRSGMPFS